MARSGARLDHARSIGRGLATACARARECYGRGVRNPLRTLAAPLVLASVAFVAPVRAAPGAGERASIEDSLDVAWSAPAECPSSTELRRRVALRVPVGMSVRARGRVDKRGGRYRLSLEISTASSRGERVLDAATCDELVESAAVVIGMSVAPPASSAGEEVAAAPAAASTTPSDEAAAAPVVAPAPTPSPAASASPDRPGAAPSSATGPSPSRILVRAEVAGDAGLLPSAAVGGGLAVGVVLVRALTIEATADLFASQDGTVDTAGAASGTRGASFGLFTAGARACLALTHGIEVAPCLGVEVARIGASGFGAAKVSDADSVTWGPEALVAARIPVAGPVSVRIGLGAFVPISRQSFVINAAGTVHQPGAVALRTMAGPEVRF